VEETIRPEMSASPLRLIHAVTKGTGQRDRRVYVVDDDAAVCDSLVVLLETYGFAIMG
jgi:hypothetical protein